MLKQCVMCNRLFEDYLDMNLSCPDCREKENQLLRDIKDFLWDYPGTTEAKLREIFPVTHEQIVKWLREERLEVTPDSSIKLTCRRCGSMILKGKFCDHCKQRVGAELEEMKRGLQSKEQNTKQTYGMVIDRNMAPGGKMHFLQNKSRPGIKDPRSVHIGKPKEAAPKTEEKPVEEHKKEEGKK